MWTEARLGSVEGVAGHGNMMKWLISARTPNTALSGIAADKAAGIEYDIINQSMSGDNGHSLGISPLFM
jgi:hypothetical protein